MVWHVYACCLSHTTFTHTIFHTQLCHTHHFSLSHTIFHIPLCHTQLFTYNLFLLLDHPSHSLPVPPATFVDHYWKELTCGVIRSFNFKFQISCCGWAHDILSRRLPLKKHTEIQMYWAHGIHSASETMLVMALIHWFIDQLGRCSSASARTHVGLGR